MSYLDLTGQEVEYVTLTRDTTDSDLKQRREIRGGTSFYHDQVGLILEFNPYNTNILVVLEL